MTAAGATPSALTVTNAYGYSTSGWGDLLTTFKSGSITYDAWGTFITTYHNGEFWLTTMLIGAGVGFVGQLVSDLESLRLMENYHLAIGRVISVLLLVERLARDLYLG